MRQNPPGWRTKNGRFAYEKFHLNKSDKLVQTNPTTSNLAVVYFKKGMFPEAESEWRSVLALKPGNVAAAQNLQMLKQSGKIK